MYTFVLCWLLVALLVSYSGVLRMTTLPMPVLGMTLTLVLLAAIAVRRDYRNRALSVGVRALVAVHLTRFIGIYFLWLYGRGLLPRDFAVRAGWGDIVVAIGALLVLLAVRPATAGGRWTILVWNIVGLADILMVFATGARMVRADPMMQAGFTSLPLSLLPTFLVPLIITTHVLIFVWLWRWRVAGRPAASEPL